MSRLSLSVTIIGLICCISVAVAATENTIHPLNGTWEFATTNQLLAPSTFPVAELQFDDNVQLPGTMAENRKGTHNTNRDERNHLSREYMFEGVAFYRRSISIPDGWKNRRVALRLERTRKSHIWLDGQYIGFNERCSVPHVYELGRGLAPGAHQLVIAVDNVREEWHPGNSHACREDTQTNWNGIVGKLHLEATPLVWIEKVHITSDIHSKTADIALTLGNISGRVQQGSLQILAKSFNSNIVHEAPQSDLSFECGRGGTVVSLTLGMGANMQLWDEFNPALYRAQIALNVDGMVQEVSKTFGMVEFRSNGRQFEVNGKTTFLRGKNDACVFPLTGYAPMDVESWVRVLRTAKSYGINHYRFHTWCPPEAALEAADIVGIYMQPELPCWGALVKAERKMQIDDPNALAFGVEKQQAGRIYDPRIRTEAEQYYMEEAREILDAYGNHPSFRMFAIGNELSGSREVMRRLVDFFRSTDGNRRLYSQGSNNHFNEPRPGKTDDYWTTVRTSTKTWDDHRNVVRASFGFVDQQFSGPINGLPPTTELNFTSGIENVTLPVIGHETGQYQYYPDFTEIDKYTGVMKPWNLEISHEIVREKGMLNQADDFFKASGTFASILYCADMEAQIRTPGFAGFQLLDLQDFPGQGTALVGPLNAFMESKGTITPDRWREYCDQLTLLAEFPEYTLTGGQTFHAVLKVANYGPDAYESARVNWRLEGIADGTVSGAIPQGDIAEMGAMVVDVPTVKQAKQVDLVLELQGTKYTKRYALWIYPNAPDVAIPAGITVSRKLADAAVTMLQAGGKILLIPNHREIMDISVGGLFMTDFWSYPMFYRICMNKGVEPSPGTMGLFIDTDHPALAGFPTKYHSNWQWWHLVKNSRPIILDDAPDGYRPLVQTIDNMWRSHRLGTLFEFRAGKGKLFVSAIDLLAIQHRPEGKALYASILQYMAGSQFAPATTLDLVSKLGLKLRGQ
jgi:hypothetical protein